MSFFEENRKLVIVGLIALLIFNISLVVCKAVVIPHLRQEALNEVRSNVPAIPNSLQQDGKPVNFKPFVIYPHDPGYDFSKVVEPTDQVQKVIKPQPVTPNYEEWSADWERVRERAN